jgi:two-component system response regulator FixJ
MGDNAVVHVIDDDEAVRESLAFLLKTADFRVRTYDSALTFLNALPGIESGCIVTDVRMPEMDGLTLMRSLKDRGVGMPVIVITGQGDLPLALEAIKGGALDFIEKPYDDDTLLDAIRSGLDGSETNAAREHERAKIQERLATLSPGERQVLNGLLLGQSNSTIAANLRMTRHTIDIHRANLMAKMEARSLSHLVRMTLLTAA